MAVMCVDERGTVTVFYHFYTCTEITKHSILKDTLRDRQTRTANCSVSIFRCSYCSFLIQLMFRLSQTTGSL